MLGTSSNSQKVEPECIELDDDIVVLDERPPKRPKIGTSSSLAIKRESSPVPEDPRTSTNRQGASSSSILHGSSNLPNSSRNMKPKGNEQQLTSHASLLDQLDAHIGAAINKGEMVERKLLDALLAAINIQVQKDPHSVRKLILEKQLILPNSISLPPSQVVDLVVEHDPAHQISKVINKLFGDERPRISEMERRERQILKMSCAAPNMTRLLIEIGQDLVQEVTYGDIVHARNLPEAPKNMDTYKQVAAQLKPIWESLKVKNEAFHFKLHTCSVCNFKTESSTIMSVHRQTVHFDGRKFQCTYCSEFDTNLNRLFSHYMDEHGIKPTLPEDRPAKVECPICDQDFNYKGQRDMHLKICRRDVNKLRIVQSGRAAEHIAMINRWLWDKPIEQPIIIAPQQDPQKQKMKHQQQHPMQLQQQQKMMMSAPHQQAQGQTRAPPTMAAMGAKRPIIMQNHIRNNNNRQPTTTAPHPHSTITTVPTAANAALMAQQQMLVQQRMKLAAAHQQAGRQIAVAKSNNNGLHKAVPTAHSMNNPQLVQTALQLQKQLSNIGANKQLFANKNQEAQIKQAMLSMLSSQVASQKARGAQQQQAGTSQSMMQQQSKVAQFGMHQPKLPPPLSSSGAAASKTLITCELCDRSSDSRDSYLKHLQVTHQQMTGKTLNDMVQGAPLACSRCRDRFWTYEGLERHLLMDHGLVTNDLLLKAQKGVDKGFCKKCGRSFAFNLVQHLAKDHMAKLCSAEIMYSCDVCAYKCTSYSELEKHLRTHPKN